MIIRVQRFFWWASQIGLAVAAMFTLGLMWSALRERQWAAALWCAALSAFALRVLASIANEDPGRSDDE